MKDRNDFTMKEVRHILWVATRKIRRLHAKNKLKQKYLSKLRQELLWLRFLPLQKEVVDKWYVRDYADYYRDFAKILEEYYEAYGERRNER